jgi:hypothetical protein
LKANDPGEAPAWLELFTTYTPFCTAKVPVRLLIFTVIVVGVVTIAFGLVMPSVIGIVGGQAYV